VGRGTQDRRETAGQGDTGDNALVPEEPDAAYLRYENWAYPGLWGFRAGNRPVLPGGAAAKWLFYGKIGLSFTQQRGPLRPDPCREPLSGARRVSGSQKHALACRLGRPLLNLLTVALIDPPDHPLKGSATSLCRKKYRFGAAQGIGGA
jgi:hypothetical protein